MQASKQLIALALGAACALAFPASAQAPTDFLYLAPGKPRSPLAPKDWA
jgi:hypothetical protein